MCQMGDGTTNIGAFHESLNLAALWQLPIVYVVVNNQLGMGTTVEKSSGEPELYKRGSSYRIKGERVDGNDVVAVRAAAERAIAAARKGRPMLLETVSSRLRGHSVVDPARVPDEGGDGCSPGGGSTARAGGRSAGVRRTDARSWPRRSRRTRWREVAARSAFAEASPPPDVGDAVRLQLRDAGRQRLPPAARSAAVHGGERVTEMTYRQALRDTLRAEMLRDENVFLIGEEIGVFEGSYKITAGLLAEFGEQRVRDTPISEEGFTGAAIGAAMLGLRPVVELMTINFSLLALDQIVNHAAKIHGMFGGQCRVPLVIRTPGGGGQQLGATHSQNIELYYAFVPGLKVVAPSNPADAKALLLAAIRDDDPVLFLENLALYNTRGEVPDHDEPAEIGRAAITRPGTDITVIGYSRMAAVGLQVAEELARTEGIDCEVIDLRSLRPLDRPTVVESVRRRTRRWCWRTTG